MPPTIVIGMPVLLTGGTEIQTLFLVRALVALRLRVVVCCYHEHEESIMALFSDAGAEIVLIDLPRTTSLVGKVRLLLKLRRVFRKLKPAALHIQYLTPGLIAVVAARLAGCRKLFLSLHYPFASRRIERSFLRFAARISSFSITNSLATEQSWFGSSHLYQAGVDTTDGGHATIYNCIDVDEILALSQNCQRDKIRKQMDLKNALVISVTGRLSAEKGHAVLLRAFTEARSRVPNLVLQVVGTGCEETALHSLAEKLGIAQNIRWWGTVSHEEAIRRSIISDCIIVPSLWEGFGLSAAEAMAAGVPVIASATGGLTELIEDGVSGLLVEPGNSGALAEAIVKIITDAKELERLGNGGKKRIADHFSLNEYQARIHSLYSGLLKD
jgi:L-malate glycosyltransferase